MKVFLYKGTDSSGQLKCLEITRENVCESIKVKFQHLLRWLIAITSDPDKVLIVRYNIDDINLDVALITDSSSQAQLQQGIKNQPVSMLCDATIFDSDLFKASQSICKNTGALERWELTKWCVQVQDQEK